MVALHIASYAAVESRFIRIEMIAEMPNVKTPFRRILSREISFTRVRIKFQTANRAVSFWVEF